MPKKEAYPYRQIGSPHCIRSKLAKHAAISSETRSCRLVFPMRPALFWAPQKFARLMCKIVVWENAMLEKIEKKKPWSNQPEVTIASVTG